MSVPKPEITEDNIKWIHNLQFELKSSRTLREEGSFHPGSNRGSGGYGFGRDSVGGSDRVLSRRPKYSNDHHHS